MSQMIFPPGLLMLLFQKSEADCSDTLVECKKNVKEKLENS